MLLSPDTVAVALVPLASAELLLPLVTVAVALSPLALARVPVLPSGVEAMAVPRCFVTTPFFETATLFSVFGGFGAFAAELSAESVDEVVSAFDGLADATHGVATSPTPMPSATASAPTRPM